MRGRFLIPIVASCAVASGACASIFGEDCVSLRGPAIVAIVTNAPTGVAPTSGLTLVIRGSAYDSVTTMFVPGLIQAGSRPGTYDVSVRQLGYREFSQRGVAVGSASCSQPVTVSLPVVLQPL